MQETKLKETVILIDADHVDDVATHLRGTFRQMMGRDISQVDLATWLVCCALDAGLTEGEHETQVVFLHSKGKEKLEQFTPGNLKEELDGTAFSDCTLGEFLMSAVPVEDLSGDDLFVQCAHVLLDAKEVKRLALVPGMQTMGEELDKLLGEAPEGKQVTLLTMQPREGKKHQEVMLGFSLMHAMGIKSEDL